ncbi:MAG: RNA polymerase subunit sigma-70 [Nocardioides sp.]|nr:RNA polymerase subunit sigma-70 [Nocardioides sp.]
MTSVLDEARFATASEQHRHELCVHGYRMLGSLEQAEDAVQEALLKAWRARDSFEPAPGGDPSAGVRAWLYRIVTTTCLDVLRSAGRRPTTDGTIDEVSWLQPVPDSLLDATSPEESAVRRETVELAYLAVIQLLPARQRAVLLLRDVEGYSAAETAAILDVSVPTVTSALQRARATIAAKTAARDADWSPAEITDADRRLLEAFIASHEAEDPAAALAVVREDVRIAMPPNPGLFVGRSEMSRFMAMAFDHSMFGEWRLLPTAANRMPAAASYLRRPGEQVFTPFKLDVIRVGQGRIAEITTFDAALFPRFGLPLTLSA